MTQEVFIKVLSAWKGFAGAAQPSTWLYRIAANHCLDLLRWKRRQEILTTSYAAETRDEVQEDEEQGRPRVADLVEHMREGMDEMDRQIVFLRYTVGLTQKEIGGLCDVSRVAITKRLKKFESRATGLREHFEGLPKLAA
jgi:RNA polymerase sigma-70 factor (ECF subfamily)